MAEPENEKEDKEEEKEEEENAEVSLTQLIDRNRYLIEGLKQQLDRAKRRMMEGPEDEE
ncbi:MAG: hypothetical protein O6952_06220 [Planctomycetota bacterium]|nr:hypothetical protein [Planctomycetota bacterium]